jgi:peptidoglycan-associated lipoprotein
MRLRTTSLLLIVVIAVILQGCGLSRRIKKADKRFSIGEYDAAAELYRSIYPAIPYKNKPLRARIFNNLGDCYRFTNQSRAERAYTNAFQYGYADVDSSLLIHYAQVLHRNGKYKEAIDFYGKYLIRDTASVVAKNGLKLSELQLFWKKNPSKFLVNKAQEFNQSRTSNFSPMFMGSNTEMLVFTSTRQLNKKLTKKKSPITGFAPNNLFMCRKNAFGKWEIPEVLEGDITSLNDEGVGCVTEDGKTLYYTRSSNNAVGDRGTEICVSKRAGGTWSAPSRIKVFKDTTISVAHPALSPDGNTLYFVSDYQKGLGGKDIWKGTLEGGECKYIENLGPSINTSGDEMFPTVKADGTLYFASNGHLGFGGLDIFKATPLKPDGWQVENMGTPINSTFDDFGITFSKNEDKGYFSTNRNELKPYDAIWYFEMPEISYVLEGKVVDEKGNPIPDAKVRLVSNTGFNARVQTKKDGTYRIKIEKNMECVLLASARGYLNQKNKLSSQGVQGSKTYKIDFTLASISKPVNMDNIFYESGKWDLTPSSTDGLQALVRLLNDNPNITIEVSANTDYVGNNEANKVLSERRAKSVVDYLKSAGIAADRLTSVGNGEEKPVLVDEYVAKKYKFVKEGQVLDEATITKLKPDQQAQVNQINRRTEFRVVKTTYKLY